MSDDDKNYALKSEDSQQELPAPELPFRPQFPEKSPAIGLLGCGGITEQHLTAYRNAGLNVVALCDLNEDNAKAKAAEFFPEAKVLTDGDALLAEDSIEVVDIALHAEPRAEWIEKALRAGKHVLSQKPFVLDLAIGEKLVAIAEEEGCLLAVHQNGRFAPYFRYAQLAIDAGLIGEVQTVTLQVCWDHGWVAGTPFEKIPHLLLYDFGIHWIDMACCLMGRPAHTANALIQRSASQDIAPALVGSAQLAFDGGIATIHLDGSVKTGAYESVEIIGTKGRISATGKPLEAHSLELITEEGIAKPALDGHWMPEGFGGAMGELLCAIADGRQPFNSAAHNLESLKAAFALIASVDEGRQVKVGEATIAGPNCKIQN